MAFDLSRLELSAETEAFFPLRGGEPPLEEQRRFGTWWIAPFARTPELDLIGLRLIPGRRLAECPVVWASGPAAITLATRVDRVVPVVVFSQMLRAPHRWIEARELLDVEWDELVGAHRELGGKDDLAVVRALVGDETLRETCAEPGPVRDAAIATALEHLDPAPASRGFRRALAAMALGEAPGPAGARIDAGDWAAALDALAFDPEASGEAVTRQHLEAAWRLFRHPAGLDVTWGHPLEPWPEPAPTDAARRLHTAARLLVAQEDELPHECREDPLWPAVAQLAAAASPFDFHGVPFLEAAAELDERGEGERALHALTAVELWNFLAGGAPMDGAIEAAHALARRRGWGPLIAITGAVASAIPGEDDDDELDDGDGEPGDG